MPVLAALTENSLAESGFLTQTGIACTWQMLQMQGPFPLNHLCRLLAADNMPLRLVLALDALCSELRPSPTASQVLLHACPCCWHAGKLHPWRNAHSDMSRRWFSLALLLHGYMLPGHTLVWGEKIAMDHPDAWGVQGCFA